jgi:hypothetical protein
MKITRHRKILDPPPRHRKILDPPIRRYLCLGGNIKEKESGVERHSDFGSESRTLSTESAPEERSEQSSRGPTRRRNREHMAPAATIRRIPQENLRDRKRKGSEYVYFTESEWRRRHAEKNEGRVGSRTRAVAMPCIICKLVFLPSRTA